MFGLNRYQDAVLTILDTVLPVSGKSGQITPFPVKTAKMSPFSLNTRAGNAEIDPFLGPVYAKSQPWAN